MPDCPQNSIIAREAQPLEAFWQDIQQWGKELGFQQLGVSDCDLNLEETRLEQWLEKGYHGEMEWMAAHGKKRSRPDELLPGTLRVISARMNYLPGDTQQIKILKNSEKAYVSRYALGRDYHKLIRKRLSQLAKKIETAASERGICRQYMTGEAISQRAFVDSAPVMERPLATKAGLGWQGKHTLVIHPDAGSWFFLGEVFTNIPLPLNTDIQQNQCGSCQACLKVCPTDAFTQEYEMDARRCISYLTIENKGAIPVEFREAMGNRVYGCDDCQAICPWNKYATPTVEVDFSPRHQMDSRELVDVFLWSEEEFLKYTEGSPIRRIGFENWLRNLAVGLGNAPTSDKVLQALEQRRHYLSTERPNPMVLEHVEWAIQQHLQRQNNPRWRRKRKVVGHKW